MRYMLLVCSDDKTATLTPAEGQALAQAHGRVSEELRNKGKMVVAERLRPESDASRVRIKAGDRQVTDGPFAETKEALGGFYVIECDSKQEALEWAKRLPLREGGFIDVRPIWPM
jgi:hypothetical protein